VIRAIAWFTRMLAGALITVVALDGRAALVAGRLRAVLPHVPGGRDRRSRTMRQAAWLLDIEIAATVRSRARRRDEQPA